MSVVNEDNFSSIQSHLDKSLFKEKNFIMKTIIMGLDVSLIDKKLLKDEAIAKLSLDKDSRSLEYFDSSISQGYTYEVNSSFYS